jgi:hypothetical protein
MSDVDFDIELQPTQWLEPSFFYDRASVYVVDTVAEVDHDMTMWLGMVAHRPPELTPLHRWIVSGMNVLSPYSRFDLVSHVFLGASDWDIVVASQALPAPNMTRLLAEPSVCPE